MKKNSHKIRTRHRTHFDREELKTPHELLEMPVDKRQDYQITARERIKITKIVAFGTNCTNKASNDELECVVTTTENAYKREIEKIFTLKFIKKAIRK